MTGPDATFPLELPAGFNLSEYFLDHNLEAGRGDKVAVRVGDRGRTYAEVHEGVRRIAAALRGAGVRPEERVLIVLPDGFEFVEAWFATLRVGAVFAMVNPLLKAKDYAYYLEYSRAAAVFTHESVLPEIAEALRGARAQQKVMTRVRQRFERGAVSTAVAAEGGGGGRFPVAVRRAGVAVRPPCRRPDRPKSRARARRPGLLRPHVGALRGVGMVPCLCQPVRGVRAARRVSADVHDGRRRGSGLSGRRMAC